MRVIAVSSQKGGTGKTTTANALAALAHKRGLRTLAIDLDPQGSLTYISGADTDAPGAYDMLKGMPALDVVQHVAQYDIIPAGQLAGAEIEFASRTGRDLLLRAAIKPLQALYDVCYIDCLPGLGTLLINALAAADDVLMPLQADTFALQSLGQLVETVHEVQGFYNAGLNIVGVVLTRYSSRSTLTRNIKDVLAESCAELGVKLLNTTIREGVAVREAQTLQQSIFDYAPKSNPAQDYTALADEIGG
jgi:chromosome partitioning protein